MTRPRPTAANRRPSRPPASNAPPPGRCRLPPTVRSVAAATIVVTVAAVFGWTGPSARGRVPAAEPSPAPAAAPPGDSTRPAAPAPTANLKLPPGFEATVYADDDLVHDASCLTTDDAGRVAVSAPGYIRILPDRDADGRADEAIPFADGPKTGAQGLCFDGTDLLAVGDAGLIRYRDADGDLRADGPPETLLKLKTGGEHHAHAIRRGPDGSWYLICGNDTGVSAGLVTDPVSPVIDPESGVLLRFDLDRSTGSASNVAVVADGLRNAYDFDFTAAGDPVTFDSDDEREVSLPWYRPTRVFRLLPGSHAGWFSRSWKRPDNFPEMPGTLARLGRGSPTGVEVYRHTRFPPPYRDAVFVCDWTFGRVIAIPIGADDRPGDPIEFLTAVGDEGFAPTDVAAPDGSLFIASGGRGTRGRVYRIRYREGETPAEPPPPAIPPARFAAPLKERVPPFPASLASPDLATRKLAMHHVHRMPVADRLRLAPSLAGAGHPAVIRFHLGRLRRNRNVDLAALEAAVTALESAPLAPDLRYDAVRLAQLALGDVGPSDHTPDTFSGYAPRADLAEDRQRIDPLRDRVVRLFPTGDSAADDEFVRLLAMLRPEEPVVLERLLSRISPDSHPTDDLHHLFAIARLPAGRSAAATRRTADALIDLDAKLDLHGLNRDTNWTERLGDLFQALATADPSLPAVLVRRPAFGRPGHVAYLGKASAATRAEAASAMLAAASAPDFRWTAEAVGLLASSSSPAASARLRDLYDDPALRGPALAALAAHAEEADRPKFMAGLTDPLIDVAEACLSALEALSPTGSAEETVALAELARRLDRDAREYAARDRAVKLLRLNVDGEFGFVSGPAGYRPQPDAVARWFTYARSRLPDAGRPAPGDDWQSLRALLTAASETRGDPARGRAIYETKACRRCHEGAAVGPDLAGVTGRFSREDLFRAIADPDRDISSRYRGTLIQTTDGRVLTGLVVYESADGLLLKDGEKASRVAAAEIEARRILETSLMPRGLLRDLRAQDFADLEAYLGTLKP